MIHRKNMLRLAFVLVMAAVCCACRAETTATTPAPTVALLPATTAPSALPTATSMPPSPTVLPSATQLPTSAPTKTASPAPTQPVKTSAVVRENTPVPQPAAAISPENAAQVSGLALWGNGSANDLAYSPDGTTLAVAASLGIYLYDDNSFQAAVIETGQVNTSLAFSPDGETLAVGDMDGKITLWRWRTKERIKTLDSGDSQPVRDLQFSPAGDAVGFIYSDAWYRSACCVDSGPIHVIQLQNGTQPLKKNVHSSSSFAFSKDGQLIFYSTLGTLWQVSVSTGEAKSLTKENVENGEFSAMTISRDGKVVAGGNRTAHFWETQAAQLTGSFDIAKSVSEAGYLAPACKGVSLENGYGEFITALDIAPDDQTFAAGAQDESIQIRRVQDGALLASTPSRTPSALLSPGIQKILYHPTQAKLIVLYGNGLIEEREAQTARLLHQLSVHPRAYSAAKVSPAGSANPALLAAAASSGVVRLMDLTSGETPFELAWQANALAFSPDGAWLAAGFPDWSVHRAYLTNGKQPAPLVGNLDQVTGVAFAQNGKMLVTAADDCSLRFWDVSGLNPEVAQAPVKIGFSTTRVSLSPDGKWLVIQGSQVSLVKKADQSVSALSPIQGWENISGVAFSPDSKILAGINGGQVLLVDVETQQPIANWNAQGSQLAFSSDGKVLAVGDKEGRLMLIDARSGKMLTTFQAHRGSITSLTFSNDGHILISTGADGTVRLWGVLP
jgi:WD40 repeat protein